MATAQENLDAARQIIRQKRARIAELEAGAPAAELSSADELKEAREELKFAEGAMIVSALLTLQAEVDAQARELTELNNRRLALLTSIRGFLALEDQDVTVMSRMISAALLPEFGDPAAVAASAADWRARLDGLLAL